VGGLPDARAKVGGTIATCAARANGYKSSERSEGLEEGRWEGKGTREALKWGKTRCNHKGRRQQKGPCQGNAALGRNPLGKIMVTLFPKL